MGGEPQQGCNHSEESPVNSPLVVALAVVALILLILLLVGVHVHVS